MESVSKERNFSHRWECVANFLHQLEFTAWFSVPPGRRSVPSAEQVTAGQAAARHQLRRQQLQLAQLWSQLPDDRNTGQYTTHKLASLKPTKAKLFFRMWHQFLPLFLMICEAKLMLKQHFFDPEYVKCHVQRRRRVSEEMKETEEGLKNETYSFLQYSIPQCNEWLVETGAMPPCGQLWLGGCC